MRANPFIAGLTCRCPQCGEGRLFAKFLDLARCEICGLDLREANPGDGQATFILLTVGALGCWGIAWSERALHWPIWLELLIWVPLIAVASLISLPPFKALMVALQHRNQAQEAVTRPHPPSRHDPRRD